SRDGRPARPRRIMSDLLANAERAPTERPAPTIDESPSAGGYWLGGAGADVSRWRERALRAEQLVERLQLALVRWRPRP
ncbi:MAG: hypothetical protein ACRELB_04360, partial [Polyangiaceae bacterium]